MSAIVISPAQAILLLIEHYRSQEHFNPYTLDSLEFMYLEGVRNPIEDMNMTAFFDDHKDTVFKDYVISYDPLVINHDPSKRYFETHLAFETLKDGLRSIDQNVLMNYVNDLELILKTHDPLISNAAEMALRGEYYGEQNLLHEYSEYIRRIGCGALFYDFDQGDVEIVQLIIRASLLGVCCSSSVEIDDLDPFPLDIYGSGIFSEENRGKILHADSDKVRNRHYGLMKGHMPLYRDDIALAGSSFPYLKPSDQATYDPKAYWNRLNFYRLVHPYSNSVSGTALCQLRALAYFQQEGIPVFSTHEDFAIYFKLFISTMLFYSGGHSLFEFVYPLSLPEVADEFQSTSIFFDSMNIEHLFRQNNDISFNHALEDTLVYHQCILQRKKLHQELTEENITSQTGALNLLNAKKCQRLLLMTINIFREDLLPYMSEHHEKLFNELCTHVESFHFNNALRVLVKIKRSFSFDQETDKYFDEQIKNPIVSLFKYYEGHHQRMFSSLNVNKKRLRGDRENEDIQSDESERYSKKR